MRTATVFVLGLVLAAGLTRASAAAQEPVTLKWTLKEGDILRPVFEQALTLSGSNNE